MADSGEDAKGFEFRKFATPRIIGGIAIVVVVLWAMTIIFGSLTTPTRDQSAGPVDSPVGSHSKVESTTADHAPAAADSSSGHATATPVPSGQTSDHGRTTAHGSAEATAATTHGAPATAQPQSAAKGPSAQTAQSGHAAPADTHATAASEQPPAPATEHPVEAVTLTHKPAPKGVTFVEATIKPLQFELDERWWGWRPNDLIDVTDNVNNFQMGVLEVTRRTAVALAERISRTGVTDALDPNLEDAMNWFMVKATSYWFPSAESKYREGLKELEAYLNRLNSGRATFYTRTDNLIPLLSSFEDLLGSCDENLVKQIDEDGSEVSFFSADDYFYYTKGVASAMATVLEAVHHDFLSTLESRHGTELLHHAIITCQQASELDPWIILDSDLSSIMANHRANMAAPISHARFYLGQLIKTLST